MLFQLVRRSEAKSAEVQLLDHHQSSCLDLRGRMKIAAKEPFRSALSEQMLCCRCGVPEGARTRVRSFLEERVSGDAWVCIRHQLGETPSRDAGEGAETESSTSGVGRGSGEHQPQLCEKIP